MITYSWTITALNSYPEYMGNQDVVFTIFAIYTGTDNTYSSDIHLSQALILDSDGTFTPYADLTEEKVKSIRNHNVVLFVADEVYQNFSYLKMMDGVYSSKDLTIQTLKSLADMNNNYNHTHPSIEAL